MLKTIFILLIALLQFSCNKTGKQIALVQPVEKSEKFRWLFGTYEYKTIDNQLVQIVHNYKAGPSQQTDVFDIENGCLKSLQRQQYRYYLYGDNPKTIGNYFFDNDRLVNYLAVDSDPEMIMTEEKILKEFDKGIEIRKRLPELREANAEISNQFQNPKSAIQN